MEYTATGPDGNDYTITGPAGASDEEVIAQIKQAVEPGSLESFGRAAVNNLPAGGQLGAIGTAAMKGEDYSKGMADWNQKAAEAKEASPIAYGAGAVTGSLAPLAIPVVGEALKAAPILTGAGLGALNAVGNTDIAKNPEEALKQGAEGAAIGGVLGGIMPTGQKAAEGLDKYANMKSLQTADLSAKMLGNLSEEEAGSLGSKLHAWDLDTGTLEERQVKGQALLKQAGEKVGSFGGGALPLEDPTPYINNLQDKMQQSAKIYGPQETRDAGIYQAGISNFRPGMTFDELADMKSGLGERAFDASHQVKPGADALADVHGEVRDAMKSIISGAPSEYQDAMTDYSQLKDITRGIQNQLGRARAQGPQMKGIGMIGRMGGAITGGNVPATATAAGLSAAIGHPLWALGLGATLSQNPQAMAAGARGLAGAIPKVAAASTLGGIDAVVSNFIKNPQSYGKFSAPLLQALQTGGKQAFSATSFVMRQQHPELNDIMLGNQKDTNETQR